MATSQRRLAVFAALLAVTVVITANAHLLAVAIRSQPDCVLADRTAAPAKRAC